MLIQLVQIGGISLNEAYGSHVCRHFSMALALPNNGELKSDRRAQRRSQQWWTALTPKRPPGLQWLEDENGGELDPFKLWPTDLHNRGKTICGKMELIAVALRTGFEARKATLAVTEIVECNQLLYRHACMDVRLLQSTIESACELLAASRYLVRKTRLPSSYSATEDLRLRTSDKSLLAGSSSINVPALATAAILRPCPRGQRQIDPAWLAACRRCSPPPARSEIQN